MDNKQAELKRTRDILVATLDYMIDSFNKHPPKFDGFNQAAHFEKLKPEFEELYNKGSLTKLKQWLRDITEIPRETGDLKFTSFIKQRTGYDFNIFEAFYKRIDNIIAKEKITTKNQYREVTSMVDYLCQANPVDDKKIEVLNNLLLDFEHHLRGKKGKSKRFKKVDSKFTYNILLNVTAPDNKKTFEISEHFTNGVYEQTGSSIMWADGGGSVLYFNGQGYAISAKWLDSQTLEVTHDKEIKFTKQDTKFYYRGDAGTIVYKVN